MKRKLSLGMLLVFFVMMFAGCGENFTADESTVFVDKNGNVTSVDVEELDQGYYDEEELEDYIEAAVNVYTEVNGKNTVKMKSLEMDGTTARLTMTYGSAQDYSDFNGIEFYQGKVVESLAAGYTYDTDLVKVEDGKAVGKATKQEIYGEDGLKVVIIRANTDVQIDGEICYVSAQNVKLTGTDSVSIRKEYYLGNDTAEATEAVGSDDTETADTEAADTASESFETDVYTFIIYR